jgi:hypothetical protein
MLVRPVPHDRRGKPARMRGAIREVRVDPGEHLRALALETPQHRIDEARCAGVAQLTCCGDGLGHSRVLGDFARRELEEANLEERAECRREPIRR